MSVRLVLPERAEDALSEGLRLLTKHLYGLGYEGGRGMLGGEYGYGVKYEDDRFMMRPFCWCDGEECPWCSGCRCPDSRWTYTIDGEPVDFGRWATFYSEVMQGADRHTPEGRRREREVDRRRKVIEGPAVCDFCLGRGVFAAHGAEPCKGAPNFWHKPSGLKVWWYKWIGRGMEVVNPNEVDVRDVIAECIAHARARRG